MSKRLFFCIFFSLIITLHCQEISKKSQKVNLAIICAPDAALSDENYSVGQNRVVTQNIESMISSHTTPILINGTLASVVLHFIQNPDDQTFKSPGLVNLQKFMKSFNPSEWEFYSIYEPEPFVLFVPKQYLEIHKSSGIHLEKLTQFEKKDINTVIKNLNTAHELSDKIAKTILTIFEPYNPSQPLSWNIILYGHGMPSVKSGTTPTKLILKKSEASIAGLPSDQFIKLIELLENTVKLNVLTWISCYGGGLNAEALQQIITLIKHHKTHFNPGVLLSVATTDEPICTSEPIDYISAFNLLNTIQTQKLDDLKSSPDDKPYKKEISIIKEISLKTIQALGFPPELAHGLIYIPTIGHFELLKSKATAGDTTTYTIKDDVTEKLIIKNPSQTYIKLAAPGELTEQTINHLETINLAPFFNTTIFQAQELNAFFKILNIKELTGKITNKNMLRALNISPELLSETINLFNVQIITFPEGLACRGYIIASNNESYPKDLAIWKKIENIKNFIVVDTKKNIKNQEQLHLIMQRAKQQIVSNGLFEKAFIRKNTTLLNSAIDLLEKPISRTYNEFNNLMQKYNIPSHILPNTEGIQNILLDLANNCEERESLVESIPHKKIIFEQTKTLNPSMLNLIKTECPEILES